MIRVGMMSKIEVRVKFKDLITGKYIEKWEPKKVDSNTKNLKKEDRRCCGVGCNHTHELAIYSEYVNDTTPNAKHRITEEAIACDYSPKDKTGTNIKKSTTL